MKVPADNGSDATKGSDAAVPPEIDPAVLDRIFGQVLPDVPADERDDSDPNGQPESWYRDNRPPHHDR